MRLIDQFCYKQVESCVHTILGKPAVPQNSGTVVTAIPYAHFNAPTLLLLLGLFK